MPSCQAMKLWVKHFAATTSTTKKQDCSVKTSRTPEDIEHTREALVKRHSLQLGNTDRTLSKTIIKKETPTTREELNLRIRHQLDSILLQVLRKDMQGLTGSENVLGKIRTSSD